VVLRSLNFPAGELGKYYNINLLETKQGASRATPCDFLKDNALIFLTKTSVPIRSLILLMIRIWLVFRFPLQRSSCIMTLTKAQIVDIIHEELPFPKNKSTEVVEGLIEIIKRTLENDEDVLISGFGKFCVKKKRERRGRNPATGSDLLLSQRKVVTFKCSGKLRDKINS
jgi:integration host factor subunit alpha